MRCPRLAARLRLPRGLAIGVTCGLLAFAAPVSAQAASGSGNTGSAAAGVKKHSTKRASKHRYSDHQYVQLATARMGFCVTVDPVDSN